MGIFLTETNYMELYMQSIRSRIKQLKDKKWDQIKEEITHHTALTYPFTSIWYFAPESVLNTQEFGIMEYVYCNYLLQI